MLENTVGSVAQINDIGRDVPVEESFDESDFDGEANSLEDLIGAAAENAEYNIDENVRGNDDF